MVQCTVGHSSALGFKNINLANSVSLKSQRRRVARLHRASYFQDSERFHGIKLSIKFLIT